MKAFIFLILFTFGIYSEERGFQFRDPIVSESDAFTMIGDSRTQYVFQLGITMDWEDMDFLGKYKSSCSEKKTGIQNAGVAGSTTEHWLKYLKSETYKPEHFHENIVLMIGGNDIQRNAYKWKGFKFNKEEELEKSVDEIHSRVIEIINILRNSNKKIIVQTHFKVNPVTNNSHNKALNDGIIRLNERLYKSYSYNKDILNPDVTLAFIEPDFPSHFFLDLVHLNPFGYQYHSYFLAQELNRRCWW